MHWRPMLEDHVGAKGRPGTQQVSSTNCITLRNVDGHSRSLTCFKARPNDATVYIRYVKRETNRRPAESDKGAERAGVIDCRTV